MLSTSGFRRGARVFVGVLLLALPLAATTAASRALSDELGERAGTALSEATTAAFPEAAPPAIEVPEAPPAPSAEPEAQAPREERLSSKHLPAPTPKPAPPKGVLVREGVVERAVRSGVRPSGNPVASAGPRPAGVALAGVSGFGSGLRDGDIVTQVGGLATPSVEAVIIAVAGAVRSGATGISAVVWRGDASFPVTVEIPDLGQRGGKRASAGPRSSPGQKGAHGDAAVREGERPAEGRGARGPGREAQ